MRMSRLVGRREKEAPSGTATVGQGLLLRGGYLRPGSDGAVDLLAPGLRVLQRIERLARELLAGLGGQEVLAGATPDEGSLLRLVRPEVASWRQLPVRVFQIATGTVPTGRGLPGLLFPSSAAVLSLHRDPEDAEHFQGRLTAAIRDFLGAVGLETAVPTGDLTPDAGAATAFLVPCERGPAVLMTCGRCGRTATAAAALGQEEPGRVDAEPLRRVATPGAATIDDVAAVLDLPAWRTAKAVFYGGDLAGLPVMVVVRGDRQVSEAKLARILGVVPRRANDAQVAATGAVAGYASPLGLDPARVRLVVDRSVADTPNLVTGANEEGFHVVGFNLRRELPDCPVVDVASAQAGDECPHCGGTLAACPAVDVAGLRLLDPGATAAAGISYLDEGGVASTPVACLATLALGAVPPLVAELHRDDAGIRWPESLAPFHVHICAIRHRDDEVARVASDLHDELRGEGLDVLLDDRDERPGSQFADADLLGAPLRLTLSPRLVAAGEVEWKMRATGATGTVARAGVLTLCRA